MSRCKQCNIEVLDETERCPLCHSVLEPTIEVENMYPDVKIKTRRMMLLSADLSFRGDRGRGGFSSSEFITVILRRRGALLPV